ncbi:MAG: peptidyl-alpha-hydroxyglycine alpha-amidating lyase family protein [bacterium]
MSCIGRTGLLLVALGVVSLGVAAQPLATPYRRVEPWPQLPMSMNAGAFGETIGVDRDPDGNIWVLHRCFGTVPAGAATCVGRDDDPPILKFAPGGELLDSWGEGDFAHPHGFHIDPDGNIWATDANGSETVLGLSAGGRGQQVFKYSPTGERLLTLGQAGVAGHGPDTFDRPTDVAVAANGDIFVTDGHGTNNRVVKFDRDGSFITTWGQTGAGPGEFNQPHTIALDSAGRVFVGDRSNSRVQVFEPDGTFVVAWTQFGRPSGMFIDEDDRIYVTDSTSNSRNNPGWKRGIYIGSAKDGVVTAFIPDPDLAEQEQNRISGASGITADRQGSVYAADVGPHRVRKYVTP